MSESGAPASSSASIAVKSMADASGAGVVSAATDVTSTRAGGDPCSGASCSRLAVKTTDPETPASELTPVPTVAAAGTAGSAEFRAG